MMAARRTATYAGYGRKAYTGYQEERSYRGVMADSGRGGSGGRNVSHHGGRYEMHMDSQSKAAYVYGNIACEPEISPEYVPVGEPEHKKGTSRQVQKNRKRALNINSAYAVFMICAAVCAVVICFLYLRLQSETVSRSEHITELQKELTELTEKNNTAYQAIEDSVNLQTVRDRAVNELGMVYTSQGSVVSYQSPVGDNVKQYNDIPENGILTKSGVRSE